MNIFSKFCERASYYPEVELEIEVDDSKFDGAEGQIYYWYLGKLVAIESFKSTKHRVIFTKDGRTLFTREALKLLKDDLL